MVHPPRERWLVDAYRHGKYLTPGFGVDMCSDQHCECFAASLQWWVPMALDWVKISWNLVAPERIRV